MNLQVRRDALMSTPTFFTLILLLLIIHPIHPRTKEGEPLGDNVGETVGPLGNEVKETVGSLQW